MKCSTSSCTTSCTTARTTARTALAPAGSSRRLLRLGALALVPFLTLAAGCPHRSPMWSPDGSTIALLAGAPGEEIDKAASQLWVIDARTRASRRLSCPDADTRYLAAGWLDGGELFVATGRWDGGIVAEGSEKLWRVSPAQGAWKAIAAPPPNETRTPRRPPVAIREGAGQALVYAASFEKVVVVEVATARTLLELEPAELVGRGPGGGFIVTRPEPGDTGAIELAAFGADLEPRWRRKLSELRDGIAKRLGKMPIEVVFNETTPCLGAARDDAGVSLQVIFSDVGWKDGIPGYSVVLDPASGDVRDAAWGVGVSGLPSRVGERVLAVLAPTADPPRPARIEALDLQGGEARAVAGLEGVPKEAIHGYAASPDGKRFAVSINAPRAELLLYDLDQPVRIPLGE